MKVEDIENGVSPSPFAKLSASDVDEKGQKYERMGIGLSNQKKVVRKGCMSPTISSSSKAIAQRKTILSERNEKSESVHSKTQMQTGSGLDPNSCDGALSSRQSGSLSYEDSGLNKSKESSVNEGLSTDQYDPLTNYLSPRPKFLRYRPNRSREIFFRQQNEVGEEIYGGTALNDEQKVLFSSGSSSEEISENEQEREEEEREGDREEIEESDEEFEEDKGWTLKGVFKFLGLLMATVLYATYLSFMNTNSLSSHGIRSNEVLSNGSCNVKDFKKEAEFAPKLPWERDFLDPTNETRNGWREEEVKMIDDTFEVISLNENFSRQQEVAGEFTHQLAEVAQLKEEEREVRGFEEVISLNEDFSHLQEVDREFTNQLAEVAELKEGEREVRGFEGGGKKGEVHLAEEDEQEFEDPFHYEEPTERKIFENVIETHDDQKPFSLEVSTNSEIAADKELAKSKTNGPEKMAGNDSNLFNLIRMLRERNYSENMIIENMNTQLFFQILISFLAFLLTLIVSVVCYRSKTKRAVKKQQFLRVEALQLENENTLEKISPLTLKACSESVIVQENNSILSQEGRPLASIWLEEEKDIYNEKYYNSRAPTVELLGEFVVGGEAGNTLKNRMIESKDSNNLVSIEERSAYSRPALSELSNSHSYGSFTAEKIVKKEVGGDGDLKAISTPVRRSSRIKNRAAMSP